VFHGLQCMLLLTKGKIAYVGDSTLTIQDLKGETVENQGHKHTNKDLMSHT
jgi:hypothetical protein